jgi:hypothetical protein
MDALDVESRIAAGEQALQALITCVRERAGKLEAHEAEQGLFTRRRPMGLAAMQRYVAQRGTGEGGPAIHTGRRRHPAAGAATAQAGLWLALRHVRGSPHVRPHAGSAWELSAGRAGQPPRAVCLVLSASVETLVRGGTPRHRACGLLGAALCSRCRRECREGGGAGGA